MKVKVLVTPKAADLDPQGVVGDLAEGVGAFPAGGVLAGQGAADGGRDAPAVADESDVEEVADALGLGAFEDEVLEQAVERLGHTIEIN